MVMNKLWKTRKRPPAFIEMAFLYPRLPDQCPDNKNSVKQKVNSGTFLHKRRGITGFFGGKTHGTDPIFCERNECRIKISGQSRKEREQSPGYWVFNNKYVIN
jgi:hypothetical protein